ncbi:MAG: AsmA-like C-terminal region-containing protein [Pseudomonadota bacterium]
MTETDPDPQMPDAKPARRSRFLFWVCSVPLGALLVVVALLAAGVWRLSMAPLSLPNTTLDWIEEQIDRSMLMNDVDVGDVAISLMDGGAPELTLRDIRLSDPDGAPRAAFPELQVTLSPSALLRGEVHPTRVEISGAGLRLSRDENGILDFEFTQDLGGLAMSLPETLARIDAMFETPGFSQLQEVVGTDLNLSMADGMTGQTIRVRDARMRLDRKGDAITLTIGGALEGSREATLDLAITRRASLERTDLGLSFVNLAARDVATTAPILSWLDLLRAPISGRLVARLADDGAVGDVSGGLQIGAGQFQVEGVMAPLSFEEMETEFAFDARSSRMAFSRLAISAPELSFAAEGHADVSDDGATYVGQFRLSDIEADPRGLFEAPLEIDGALIDLRLSLEPNLRVEIGQAAVFDGDLQAHASALIVAQPEGVDISGDARLDDVGPQDVLSYWPVDAIERTRRWMVENVQDARLRGVDFALRWPHGHDPSIALQFDFEDAVVRALRHYPPIEGGAGYFELRDRRLIVRMDDGVITAPDGGPVTVAGSSFVIPRTGPGGPPADLDVEVSGQLTDVLRLLNRPPTSIFQRGGRLGPDDLGQGLVTASAQVRTRLMRNVPWEDIDFTVDGQLRDYASETLVPERRLAADVLQIAVDKQSLRILGRATLDDVRLNGQWSRAIGPDAPPGSQVEARMRLDRDALARLGVLLPAWLVSGQTEADIVIALAPETPPALELRSDLDGLGLAIPSLGWRLSQSRTGSLYVEAQLGPTPTVPVLRLEGAGLSFDGRVELAGARLQRIVANQMRIGSWLDVAGSLNSNGPGRQARIVVTSGSLDLRGAPQSGGSGGGSGGGGGQAGGPGASLSVNLDRLQVTDAIALRAVQAELETPGGLSGQFNGRVNGDAPVTGTLISTPAGPAVRVRAQDGGAVLRSAGLLQSVHGGELELIIGATGAHGVYDGQLEMSGPRLRDAPAMAELLNIISVVGLLEQLGGDGINLGNVEARFQIRPSQVILNRGSALGPSIGLSMDGAYDIAARELDMQGVVSPLYAVNGMFGALFSARREGLFGFSYRLTGTPQDTNVSVNPLSILTPGIFREIFRRPPPEIVDTQ